MQISSQTGGISLVIQSLWRHTETREGAQPGPRLPTQSAANKLHHVQSSPIQRKEGRKGSNHSAYNPYASFCGCMHGSLWLDLPQILFPLTSKLIFGHRSLFFNFAPLVLPRDNYSILLSFLISTPTLMIYELRFMIPQTRPYQ
jgi:hypothetical protein